jgi:hypothetical protein
MAVRKFLLGQALESYTTLLDCLLQLTEEEVLAALELEAATRRRRSVINRLISRAARINELNYVAKLKEKFHGTSHEGQQHDQGRTQGSDREPEAGAEDVRSAAG